MTDRMSSATRTRLVREGSGMSSSGSTSGGNAGLANVKDLKALLSEQDCLPGSSGLSAKQVDDIMQQTAKSVGDANVEWTKRLNMVSTTYIQESS